MFDENTRNILSERQARLKRCIEETCKFVDRYTADTYQLFTGEGYNLCAYKATRALNSRLKKLLRLVPTMKIVIQDDIFTVVQQGMLDVREKYEHCGADESEVTWMIEYAVDKLFQNLREVRLNE